MGADTTPVAVVTASALSKVLGAGRCVSSIPASAGRWAAYSPRKTFGPPRGYAS
jgi:hypothetical protein